MKQVKTKIFSIAAAMFLSGLLGIQPTWAGQPDTFDNGVSLSDGELADQRGQGGGIISNAQVNGNVINIGAGGMVINGNNIIGEHSLDNVSGITSVIQNSGNNVAIQNSTVVNVSFQ